MVQLHALFNGGKKSLRARLAESEAEVERLKREVGRLNNRNRKLEQEALKLSLRNGELEVAYNGLKKILRNRGVSVPDQDTDK